MVSAADKYKRLGITSVKESVDEDDIDKLAINYTDLTVNLSLVNTADVTLENTSSTDTITETVTLRRDGVVVNSQTVQLDSNSSVTITFNIVNYLIAKQYVFESGRDDNIVSDTVIIR